MATREGTLRISPHSPVDGPTIDLDMEILKHVILTYYASGDSYKVLTKTDEHFGTLPEVLYRHTGRFQRFRIDT